MKGQVTRTHIKNGKPCSLDSCPIALSLNEKFPDAQNICVDDDKVSIDGNWYAIRRGKQFIDRFDAGLPVKPITYELTALS